MYRHYAGVVAGLLLALALARTVPSSSFGQELLVDLANVEQRVVDLVNVERAKANLPALQVAPGLVISARRYAEYLASANFFSHTGPDGSTLASRNEAAGYAGWTFLGENLAAGQTSPDRAMEDWMNSPGHRANILSPSPREIGVGYFRGGSYGNYWVQEFGSRRGLQQTTLGAATAASSSPSWTSPATGHTVTGEWLDSVRAMGGLDNIGHPRSAVMADPTMGGQTVQYFQRAVLEYHPENPGRYRYQRRLLGDILYPGSDAPVNPNDPPPGPSAYFRHSAAAPTGLGHFVANATRAGEAVYFKDYFDQHGGVDAFGFPKEEPKLRDGLWTQRFQAALFEYHPEHDREGTIPGTNIPYRNYRVQLRLLGDEYISRNGLPFR